MNEVEEGVTLSMPEGYYDQERATMFGLLAQAVKVRELHLRIALSNVFVTMTMLRRARA